MNPNRLRSSKLYVILFVYINSDGSILDQRRYDYGIVKLFLFATLFWLCFAILVGTFIAFQLIYPNLNFDSEYFTYGRLRPIHTTGVIFAFAGNILLGSSFFVVQRTSSASLALPKLARFVFWGYQLFIIIASLGYTMGITHGKEYAEPEWQADLWLTLVWVCYIIVYIATLRKRKEKHIYVANWFYMSFMIVIAILHIGNNICIPIAWDDPNSIQATAGLQSAILEWWYAHNAVGFLLTAGFLGAMYYFIPKQASNPVYSYRLSVLHFWSFIFFYLWAGPHHLIYTSMPDWAQTLGMTMSILLWAPSWGGMFNGMMTIIKSKVKLKDDPILCFFMTALIFYGSATIEGPLLSIKTINAFAHYTDMIVAHVHSAGIGWVSMISFGMIYYMVPKVFGKSKMYSIKLVWVHYIFSLLTIFMYLGAIWTSGVIQGAMFDQYNELGVLQYTFMNVVLKIKPYHFVRAISGIVFLSGIVVMLHNVFQTIFDRKNESA